MVTFQGFMTRLSILLTGVCCGVMFSTLGMLSDSGTALANTMAMFGLLGSLFLFIGGIVGALFKRWVALVPGAVFVLTALTPAVPPFAIASILLIYCCFFKPRNIRSNEQDADEIDDVPIVQLKAYEDEILSCNSK